MSGFAHAKLGGCQGVAMLIYFGLLLSVFWLVSKGFRVVVWGLLGCCRWLLSDYQQICSHSDSRLHYAKLKWMVVRWKFNLACMPSEGTSSRDFFWPDVMTNINRSQWRVRVYKWACVWVWGETVSVCLWWGEGEQKSPALCLSSSLACNVSSLPVLYVQMSLVSAFPWDSNRQH